PKPTLRRPVPVQELLPTKPLDIGLDHHLDQLPEGHLGLPAELSLGKRAVPDQKIDFSGAHELRVLNDNLPPVQIEERESDLHEVLNTVGRSGRDNVVEWLIL